MYLPSWNIAALQWETKKDFIEKDTATNIFIAAFTTCHARLKLYSEIEKLGDAVLYFDTDSIIYESCGTNDPPTGNFLGQFTDELNGDTIKTFVSGMFHFKSSLLFLFLFFKVKIKMYIYIKNFFFFFFKGVQKIMRMRLLVAKQNARFVALL